MSARGNAAPDRKLPTAAHAHCGTEVVLAALDAAEAARHCAVVCVWHGGYSGWTSLLRAVRDACLVEFNDADVVE